MHLSRLCEQAVGGLVGGNIQDVVDNSSTDQPDSFATQITAFNGKSNTKPMVSDTDNVEVVSSSHKRQPL